MANNDQLQQNYEKTMSADKHCPLTGHPCRHDACALWHTDNNGKINECAFLTMAHALTDLSINGIEVYPE